MMSKPSKLNVTKTVRVTNGAFSMRILFIFTILLIDKYKYKNTYFVQVE